MADKRATRGGVDSPDARARTGLPDEEGRLAGLEGEPKQNSARQQRLLACYQSLLVEGTAEEWQRRLVDSARELTGGRAAAWLHVVGEGAWRVGVTSGAGDGLPWREGETLEVEGSAYLDLMGHAPVLRLTADEAGAQPAWRRLFQGQREEPQGLLGAGLTARDGQDVGLLLVADKEDGGAFTAEDGTLLGQLAAVASLTMRERQERQEAERVAGELAGSLEAEHARLAAVIQNLPIGVWVADPSGHLVQKNDAADRIWLGDAPLSLSVDEYTRYSARDAATGVLLAPEDYPMSRSLASGQPVGPQELVIRRFDGSQGRILVSAAPFHDAQGLLLGSVGINVDITERQQNEAERERLLAENHRQRVFLERLVETVPIGIAVTQGAEHRFVLANQRYRALMRKLEGDLLDRTLAEVFPWTAAAGGLDPYDQVLAGGQSFYLKEYQPMAGTERENDYWEVNLAPLTGEDDGVEGVLTVVHDVTEAMHARHKIEYLAARDQVVLESMSDGLVLFDLDGNLLEMNPAALRLHGLAGIDEARRNVREFATQFHLFDLDGRPIPPDDWPVPRVARGETYTALEARVRHVITGDEQVWSYNGTPVRDREGRVTLGLVTIRDVTRQKAIEDELRRHFVLLDQLIDQAPVGIALVSGPDHRYELLNPAYRTIPGMSGLPMIGQTLAQVFPEVAARGGLDPVDGVYRTRSTFSARDHPLASVDPGQPDTYWNVDYVPLLGAGGEVERVLILTQEVTESVRARQQVEQALAELAEERARLQAILQNAPVGIVLADEQARILLSNPVAERLYSRPVPHGQDYESHALLRLCKPDGTPYDPRHLPLTRSAVDGETWRDLEMMVVWPDGQWRDLLVNTAPVRGVEGEIVGAVGVFQDISERNEARRALRRARDELEERVLARTRELMHRSVELQLANESLNAAQGELKVINKELVATQARLEQERQRYWALFDFAPDGYLVTDLNGHIVEANQAAGGLLGVEAANLPGTCLDDYVAAVDGPIYGDYLYRLRLGGEETLHWEMRLQSPGGGMIHVAVAGTQSYSAVGKVEGIRWLLRDVTHEKQMQTALVRAEKLTMVGRLAASLAHEINNPLAAAMGSVELVREAVADAQDPGPLLDVMYASLARAARIVSQLRDAHRHPDPEEKQPANLNDMVDNVLLLMSKPATIAGVKVAWHRVDGVPDVPLMVDGMQQVFLNLVLNAIEAMPGGGHLAVRLLPDTRPGWIGVEFANDGPPIPPDVREQLFDPFESTKPKGAGLGLFISQNIVQQHGGDIKVETGEDQGVTFTVWLPL